MIDFIIWNLKGIVLLIELGFIAVMVRTGR